MKSSTTFVSRLLVPIAGIALSVSGAYGEVVYNSIPSLPLPSNVSSVGYQATQTSEFGNAVNLAGGARQLTSIDVVMSDWAKKSDWPSVGTSTGYFHLLTLNLYNVGPGGAVGSVVATDTINAFIPWRPETTPACAANDGYGTGGSDCSHGIASTVTFDFTSANVVLPDSLVFGLAFGTTNYGYALNPYLLQPGPYESLNFGVESLGSPTVGSDVYPGSVYWNTSTAGNYTDGGAGGVGVFRQDTNWSPYTPEVTINADTPEPGTFALLGGGFALLAALRRRRAA